MAKIQVNPTRMELTRLKHKLVTATRGHKLLKDKRDELMRQFLELIRQNKTLREKTEHALNAAARNFALARAVMQDPVLDTALLAPSQEVTLHAGEKNVMGVRVPQLTYQTRSPDESNIYSYGLSFTSGDLDDAVKSLADVLPDMLALAEIEKSCQLMAAEIEKTRRRVNALEYVMIPDLQETIKYITMKLDENERSSQNRLMKVKDMMLEKAHRYSEKNVLPVQ
ncbi:MAG: V-type ATP synthase subunit D [Christensenellales bacterium]|jgi:V/A-type H+-transporting ATPase subunit D